MARKMLDRYTPRRAVRIITDDSVVVRDPLTAYVMSAPRRPLMH